MTGMSLPCRWTRRSHDRHVPAMEAIVFTEMCCVDKGHMACLF